MPDLFDPSHFSRFQSNLDAVWMLRRLRENIPNDTASSLARALIFFQHDLYFDSRSEVFPVLPVHD
jgi:hypothetical protein